MLKCARPARLKVRVAMTACLLGTTAILGTAQAAEVTMERLLNAEKEPQNWITHHGSFASHR
jgi:hypothetical protein